VFILGFIQRCLYFICAFVYDAIPSLPEDIDMKLHVAGIRAAVGGKLPLSVFENVFIREYLAQLNPKHHPPYCLERIRIIEYMIDYAKLELGFIMEESHLESLSGFLSGTIDFWVGSHRTQQFGCFVVDMIAGKYELENWQALSMSRKIRTRLQDDIFADSHAALTLKSLKSEMFVSICNLNNICSWHAGWFERERLHRVASGRVII
jgi:hypothetical protein